MSAVVNSMAANTARQDETQAQALETETMLQNVAQDWLTWQCSMIAGACHGVVALGEPDRGPFRPAACWPAGSEASPALSKTAKAALSKRRGVVGELDSQTDSDGSGRDAIAYPIVIDGKLLGVAAIEVARQPNVRQKAVLQMLQWGAAWFQALCAQQGRAGADQPPARDEKLALVLELVGTAVSQERFQAAATAAVTEAATKFGCERVSLGFLHGKHIKVKAVSHSARFEGRQSLFRQIGAAMDESLDQEATIVYPATSKGAIAVSQSHRELARHHGARAICTVPLSQGDRIFGAMTLERPGSTPFEPDAVQLFEQLGALLGPILEVKRRDDRWISTKVVDTVGVHLKRFFGAGHLVLKTVVLVLVSLVAYLSVGTGTYRVASNASLEGAVERVAVAPQDGFVASASVRPGDLVKEGQQIATLDSKDLELERVKWSSQREQLVKEYREALATNDRAQVSILKARIDQSDAQLALLDEQLARMQIIAPFDGVIVSGDLTRSLGSPVERGQVLYKIAPLHDYRVMLEVDERDYSDVAPGQVGTLALTANPDELLAIVVNKITPVSTAKDGGNFFQVEAALEEPPAHLRPGMKGVGKIEVGEQKLIWIWTHRVIDWLRLWVWSWWP